MRAPGRALTLRVLAAVGVAAFVFVYLPHTAAFRAMADWCLHDLMPLLATDLGLSGHPLAHLAAVLPGLALGASVLWVAGGLARAWLPGELYDGPLAVMIS